MASRRSNQASGAPCKRPGVVAVLVLTVLVLAVLVLAGRAPAASAWAADPRPIRFAVFYGETTTAPLDAYDLLVFESDRHPPLAPLRRRDKKLLGYLSIGEVHEGRPYFEAIRSQGLLVTRNESWAGAHMVDVRDARWRDRVVHALVPQVLRAGFTGVFLDTADSPIHLEREQPTTYAGMTAATAELVLAIRRSFPDIAIMLNRGYEILEQVGGAIDMALGESVYADYDAETRRYRLVEPATYQLQVSWLKAAKARNPKLAVYSLDYWDPADTGGIARIYAEQRHNGFIPYVATVELDRIVPEPRR